MDRYLAFSYLRRDGYIVIRSRIYEAHNQLPSHPQPLDGKDELDKGKEKVGETIHVPENKKEDLLRNIDTTEFSLVDPQLLPQLPTAEIQKQLRIIGSTSFNESRLMPPDIREWANYKIRIDYDIYKTNTKNFKKSNPGLPDFRVVVCNIEDSVPSLYVIEQLSRLSGSIPLRICVVGQGI